MTAIKEADPVETRTLLVEDSAGEFKITIPAAWKVTFGAFQNNTNRYGDAVVGGPALRIYEAENKQRACFVGVRCFRDMSIPMERAVIRGDAIAWEADTEGAVRMTQRESGGRAGRRAVRASLAMYDPSDVDGVFDEIEPMYQEN
jgi:hypothetical protein